MKNKFIKSTIILILGGLITKVLSMVIRIYLTRIIGTEGLSLYMLILPTFDLFICLSTIGVPIAINKLIAERKRSTKKIILPTSFIVFIYNIILILVVVLLSPLLSRYLLKNDSTLYPLMAISLTLPFIAISSIVKGYLYGKEKVLPITISNIIEQLVRIFLIIFVISKTIKYGITTSVTYIVLFNIVTEVVSIFIMGLFIPRYKISLEDFYPDKSIIKEILNISIPSTMSRIIGSISYFLEPIILINLLTYSGYTTDYINIEYAIINGYSESLLLMPSFFISAISTSILPIISNSYSHNNIKYTKSKIKEALIFSLIISMPFTLIFMFIPSIPLKIIYNTNLGINYIKVYAPFFILLYVQAPLTAALNAMGKAKEAMKGTIYGTVLRVISLSILSLVHIGMWSLVISTIINIVVVTLHHIYYVNKYLKNSSS